MAVGQTQALEQQVQALKLEEVGHSTTVKPQPPLSASVDSSTAPQSDTGSKGHETESTPTESESPGSIQPMQVSTEPKAKMAATNLSSPRPKEDAPEMRALLDYSLSLESPRRVRNYQWELAEPGIAGQNYIVCAPTGTGKTLVAALVISEHLKNRRGNGKVVFLVNTKPLAQQQQDEIQKFIPGASVECCTGDDLNRTVQLLLEHSDVVVCTAGKMLYELKQDTIKFDQISLMIFDECHHTHKDTPYANIMAQYLEEAARDARLPQVVGMTASPGAGTRVPELEKTIDHLISLCALLNATGGIKIVKDNAKELDSYTNKPTFRLQVFDRRDPSDPFVCLIGFEMEWLEECVKLQCPFDRWSQEYETSIQQKKGPLEMSQSPEKRDQISALEVLRHFSLVLSIYMDLRYEDALFVLDEISLPSEEQASPFEKEIIRRVDTLKSQLLQVPKIANPLLTQVEIIIRDQFSQKPESRGILFVRTKKHASCIHAWASQLVKEIRVRPAVITGHTRETGPGMTEVEQTQVIQGFQEGKYNLLVATSVAEEGLDVPACNLVIRFQHVSNEIAKVQTRGRARASGAVGFTILSSDSKKKYQELINAELEVIVEEALYKYLPEGRAFTKQLGERQKELISERAMKQVLRAEKRAAHSPDTVHLLCKKCKVVACSGTDIYTVENGTHYVVANEEFKESKIVKRPHPKPRVITDKISKTHKIYCANCDADWGVMFTWPSQGNDFPVLKCIRFIFEVSGIPRQVSKWSNAPFDVPPLSSRPEYQLFD